MTFSPDNSSLRARLLGGIAAAGLAVAAFGATEVRGDHLYNPHVRVDEVVDSHGQPWRVLIVPRAFTPRCDLPRGPVGVLHVPAATIPAPAIEESATTAQGEVFTAFHSDKEDKKDSKKKESKKKDAKKGDQKKADHKKDHKKGDHKKEDRKKEDRKKEDRKKDDHKEENRKKGDHKKEDRKKDERKKEDHKNEDRKKDDGKKADHKKENRKEDRKEDRKPEVKKPAVIKEANPKVIKAEATEAATVLPAEHVAMGRPINPHDYWRIYTSLPFIRSEYEANPSYRHEATMEILFGHMRPTVNVKQPRAIARPQALSPAARASRYDIFPDRDEYFGSYGSFFGPWGAGSSSTFAYPGAYGIAY